MRQDYPDPIEMEVLGFAVMLDDYLGHLAVTHDGSITWDHLQAVKNAVWARSSRNRGLSRSEHDHQRKADAPPLATGYG
ncbi:hypothetical protein RHVG_00033 [Rhodovulum phage RS1]|uniref:hypothetical protein n=1 Tax=Rhodovulum phage RS1 TaxID=754056 RepID=UPI0002C18C26|nr:hypothetical protein RHVG_00033 [Rhodovulum phage RS1]AGH57998.1 hypothetical protein RHVG_00033 [Rhodovulum phage RS1]